MLCVSFETTERKLIHVFEKKNNLMLEIGLEFWRWLKVWRVRHRKRSPVANGRMEILVFVLALLQHWCFPAASADSVIDAVVEEHTKFAGDSAITSFVAAERNQFRDIHRAEHEEGFIFPSSIRILHVEGSALGRCKSACSLMLQAMNDGEEIGTGIASTRPKLHSCSLKKLMVFPDLNVGKYRLWTNCVDEDNRACYTDPNEILFEVSTDDSEGEVIHLGKLTIFARPLTRVTNTNFESRSKPSKSRLNYALALERWRGATIVATVFILVGAGLLLISYFTNEDHR